MLQQHQEERLFLPLQPKNRNETTGRPTGGGRGGRLRGQQSAQDILKAMQATPRPRVEAELQGDRCYMPRGIASTCRFYMPPGSSVVSAIPPAALVEIMNQCSETWCDAMKSFRRCNLYMRVEPGIGLLNIFLGFCLYSPLFIIGILLFASGFVSAIARIGVGQKAYTDATERLNKLMRETTGRTKHHGLVWTLEYIGVAQGEMPIPNIVCESTALGDASHHVEAGFAPGGGFAQEPMPVVIQGTVVSPMGPTCGGGAGNNVAEQLAHLAQLHLSGALSDAEFVAAKQKVLSSM